MNSTTDVDITALPNVITGHIVALSLDETDYNMHLNRLCLVCRAWWAASTQQDTHWPLRVTQWITTLHLSQ